MSVNINNHDKLWSDYIYLGTLAFTLCVLIFSYSYAASIEVPSGDNNPIRTDISDKIPISLPQISIQTETSHPEPLVAAGSVSDEKVKNGTLKAAPGGDIDG